MYRERRLPPRLVQTSGLKFKLAKLSSGFMLACAVAKRGGLEGTAVAGARKP